MNFLAILAISLNPLLRQYMWLILLVGCILIALGIIIGYILGNTSLKRFFYKELEEAEHQGAVQKSVTDNVGMGIIVYDDNEAIYVNNTLSSLKGFIKNGVPRNLQVFLDTYDNGNYLKSNYILSQENGTDNIRVNYVDDNRVFEIKILKKEVSYCDKENFEDKNITEIENLHQQWLAYMQLLHSLKLKV